MGVKLHDLLKQTRTIYVEVGASELLEVEYRVQAYTPEVESELINAEQRPAKTLSRILNRLVARWNLLDDSGEMYPLDEESTSKLPLSLMLAVFSKIAEDLRPNPLNTGD